MKGLKMDSAEITDIATEAPPMTVLYWRTGRKMDLSPQRAKEEIGTGEAVETIPTDPKRASKWLADLRASTVERARQEGREYHLKAFGDYETWCQKHEFRVLPMVLKNLVLYALTQAANGIMDVYIRQELASISAIHDMVRHPPHGLFKSACNDYIRAISFAKSTLGRVSIFEAEDLARKKALEMFSDGVVPMRWCDLAS